MRSPICYFCAPVTKYSRNIPLIFLTSCFLIKFLFPLGGLKSNSVVASISEKDSKKNGFQINSSL